MAKKTTKTTTEPAAAGPPKPLTLTQFGRLIDDVMQLKKGVGQDFLRTLEAIVVEQLGPDGPGEVRLPGLLKVKRAHRPAKPAREGVDPFTRQPKTFKARPASVAVRAVALKSLRDAVAG